ncbi:MAG: hypothetical protein CO090_07315 [Acidobacteria bacterium CG_4_9_14_3_um_filter_49_7]|nr:MAG: hypothetical protein CO090_07315 [Acidobacteria bacterium CG_4_9_14_3_um_filter_49_7]
MSNQPSSHHSSNQSPSRGFFRSAIKEWGRKWARRKWRRQLKKAQVNRTGLLANIGQAAWQNGIRVAGSDTVWETLTTLSGQSGTVPAATHAAQSALQDKTVAYQEAEKQWNGKLQGASADILSKKQAYDELHRAILAQHEADRTTRSRLEAIQREVESLRGNESTAAISDHTQDPERQIAAREQERHKLVDYLTQVDSYLNSVQPQLATLQEQLEQASAHEQQLSEQKKAELTDLGQGIRALEQQLKGLSSQQNELSGKTGNLIRELGQLIVNEGSDAPALLESLGLLRAHDDEMRRLEETLASSREESSQMPRGTMAKFFLTIVGVPVFFFIFIFGGLTAFHMWQSWFEMQSIQSGIKSALQPSISPYLNHPLKNNPAYRLADRLAAARDKGDEKAAKNTLLDICKKIHLGIYTIDNKQILAGAERNDKDFYLYDFQRGILARSYIDRNVTGMPAHNRLIAKLVFKTDQNNTFDQAFRELLAERYQDAVAHPDRPENFLPLLIDGLARHEVTPHSLGELTSRSIDQLDVDDIQSFLIFLDFFVPAPPEHEVRSTVGSFSLSTPVYASSLCDKIAGKEAKSYWEKGSSLLPDFMEKLPGKAVGVAAKGLGNSMSVLGVLGDILILRGIQLEIRPAGGLVISLPHTNKSRMDDSLPTYQFTAVATFQCEVSAEVAKCGWLVGKSIPENGPLQNVEITWDFSPQIGKRVAFHDADEFIANTRMLTNENGKAAVTLRAMPCPAQDGTLWKDDFHKVTASGRFVSAQIPSPLSSLGGPVSTAISMLPGFYEIVTGGRKAYSTLDVNYHENEPGNEQY